MILPWIHVDAAYAGSTMLHAHNRMIDYSYITSININGSKWFKCAFDSAFLFCRDFNLIKNNIGMDKDDMSTKYVDLIESEETFDFMTVQLQQGRRFRALRV